MWVTLRGSEGEFMVFREQNVVNSQPPWTAGTKAKFQASQPSGCCPRSVSLWSAISSSKYGSFLLFKVGGRSSSRGPHWVPRPLCFIYIFSLPCLVNNLLWPFSLFFYLYLTFHSSSRAEAQFFGIEARGLSGYPAELKGRGIGPLC